MNSFKSIQPRNLLPSYNPGQEVNFDLQFPNEALKANSVYLTGKLHMAPVGLIGDEKYFDPLVGCASFMENVIIKCDSGLFSEVITNYSRLVKVKNLGMSPDEASQGMKNSAELVCGNLEHTTLLIQNTCANGDAVLPFSHRFHNALNSMVGDLDYSRTGRITLSFKLPIIQKCVFGATAPTSYTLSELEVHYMTVPAGSPSVSVMVVNDTQKLISTTNSTVYNTFTQKIDSCLLTFAPTTVETDASKNSLVCSNPNINKLQFAFNNQSNQLVAYSLENQEELLLSGYSVLANKGMSADIRTKLTLAVQDPSHNFTDGYLVGLQLGQLEDFRTNALSVNMRINNLPEQLYCYMYGFGVQTLF